MNEKDKYWGNFLQFWSLSPTLRGNKTQGIFIHRSTSIWRFLYVVVLLIHDPRNQNIEIVCTNCPLSVKPVLDLTTVLGRSVFFKQSSSYWITISYQRFRYRLHFLLPAPSQAMYVKPERGMPQVLRFTIDKNHHTVTFFNFHEQNTKIPQKLRPKLLPLCSHNNRHWHILKAKVFDSVLKFPLNSSLSILLKGIRNIFLYLGYFATCKSILVCYVVFVSEIYRLLILPLYPPVACSNAL